MEKMQYYVKKKRFDGKIMNKNLKAIGKDQKWLNKQIEKFKMKPEEALVVTLDGKGQIFCQRKEL